MPKCDTKHGKIYTDIFGVARMIKIPGAGGRMGNNGIWYKVLE